MTFFILVQHFDECSSKALWTPCVDTTEHFSNQESFADICSAQQVKHKNPITNSNNDTKNVNIQPGDLNLSDRIVSNDSVLSFESASPNHSMCALLLNTKPSSNIVKTEKEMASTDCRRTSEPYIDEYVDKISNEGSNTAIWV